MSQYTIDIAVSGGAGIRFIEGNTGGPEGPDAAGVLSLVGSGNIAVTAGPGANELTISDDGSGGISWQNITFFGEGNTFLGEDSGNLTLTPASAVNNVGLGRSALTNLTVGSHNDCIGFISGEDLTSGSRNSCLGSLSLTDNPTGNDNVAIGYFSLTSATSGDFNTGVGSNSFANLNSGEYNIALGYNSGSAYTGSESSNILIGHPGMAGEFNRIHIGVFGSGNAQQNQCNIHCPLYVTGNISTTGSLIFGYDETTLFVDGNTGNDANGNGSSLYPWQSLTYAYSQITDASTSKRYTIILSGAVTESVAVKPWTEIVGYGAQNSTITGTLTLDSSWTTVAGTFTLKDLFVTEVDFDSSAMGGGTFPTLFFSGVQIGTISTDDLTLDGGANEGSLEIRNCIISGSAIFNDYGISWFDTQAFTIEYDRPNGSGLNGDSYSGGQISSSSPNPFFNNSGAGAVVITIRDFKIAADIDVDGLVSISYDIDSYPVGGFNLTNGATANSIVTTPNTVASRSVTSATYTTVGSDCVLLCNRAGTIAITLHDPSVANFVLEIKDISGNASVNNITLTPASGNIDGAASYVINTNYGATRVLGDGTNYWVLYG